MGRFYNRDILLILSALTASGLDSKLSLLIYADTLQLDALKFLSRPFVFDFDIIYCLTALEKNRSNIIIFYSDVTVIL